MTLTFENQQDFDLRFDPARGSSSGNQWCAHQEALPRI